MITMPRTTEEILAHADELSKLFEEGPDPIQTVEADAIEGLQKAVVAAANAQKVVHAWIVRAREQGRTWGEIGGALGTSGEAARQRYTGGSAKKSNVSRAKAEAAKFEVSAKKAAAAKKRERAAAMANVGRKRAAAAKRSNTSASTRHR